MGIMAESIAAYAKPLLESMKNVQIAMMLAQICWNISVTPEEKREEGILRIQKTFEMSDSEFDDFRKDVIEPMILRHMEMFPKMHK
jgi:hypothetical protein